MDTERVKGSLKKLSGSIKEQAGKLTGNKDLEADGIIEKTEGEFQDAIGQIKDGARKIIDDI